MAISPLQLARIPDLLNSTLASGQINATQQQLALVEQQLSTGKLWAQPSDDPGNAAITMQLQRTLTQKQTYSQNLASAQSQLGQVDNSLSSLTSLLQQAQTIASSAVNSDVTDAQRVSDAQIVDSIFNQTLSIANTQYNGLYLFAGDKNTSPPYVSSAGGVQFVGTSDVLKNSVDSNTKVAFMVDGASVFGGTSSQVKGTVDLTPNLTGATRLSDLRGATGEGVQPGSFQLGNGTTSAVIDLSNASSVSDVVNAINAAAVGGITASIIGQGITLTGGASENITVTDLGGSIAKELGIAKPTGAGVGTPLVGASVQPNVTVFTPLSTLKGGAGIDPSGISIKNGLQSANISFAGLNTVGDLLNAINGSKTSVQATIDPSGTGINVVNPVQGSQMTIAENGGTSAADLGIQSFTPQTLLSDLNDGKGVSLAASGNDFTVNASDGTNFGVSLAGATTVQDVINKINAASGGTVVASFSANSNGISLTDTTGGGGSFTVNTANASTAATDLGLTQNAAAGTNITGTDVNPISSAGIFADLSNLRNALRNGNQKGITDAAQGLQNDYNQAVQVRAVAGAQVQEMQSRQDQITTENTTTQSLMSQLSDTDFTEAITKFQTLQTSLQATLQTAAKTLHLSLLDFLG